jgi:ATP-dependent Zn protease
VAGRKRGVASHRSSAARRGQDEVRQKDFLDALEKIVLGPEGPLLMSPPDGAARGDGHLSGG